MFGPKKVILGEATQSQKDKYCIYLLIRDISCKVKDTHVKVHITREPRLTRKAQAGTHRSPWEGDIEEILWMGLN